MGLKQERIESIIKKEITNIIQLELSDPSIGFCTITDVEVTNDYSFAKIFVSFLGQEERQQAGIKALNRAKGRAKSLLSKRITIRKTPDLIFELDKTYENARKIEKIIQKINK